MRAAASARRSLLGAALACAAWGAAAQAPAPAAATAAVAAPARVQAEVVKLPLVVDGTPLAVTAHLYKPPGDGPFPLVIFSHGRAPDRIDRVNLKTPVLNGHANYWLRKGVAVVAPIRPGYGETGGADREGSGGTWQGTRCVGRPDFTQAAVNARATVLATYQWALAQPWVRRDRILLEGQSVGGMTTAAAAALNLPGVVGTVNFSGGSGGNPTGSPGASCMPEQMQESYRAWGKEAKGPSLWLYAPNDLYWGPDVPKTWAAAYAEGGSDMQFVETGPVEGEDGHQLLSHGGRMWSAPLDAFVRKVGLLKP